MPRLGTQRRPFVGRQDQLAALGEAFAAVRRGRTVAVFVHGSSGVGKSALMRRFLGGLIERDEAVVLAGRCYEQESVAYKALDTLIDALIRYLRRLPRREADVLMPRDVPALARVFPVLRRIEAVAKAPQRAQAILDQQELRRRAFAAMRELLARIGDRRPLVLAIDDLQWGDVDSASLLSDLLRPPDPPALLLVGAYRSEDAAVSPCLRKLLGPSEEDAVLRDRREVAVAALSPSEGRALALALMGQDDEAAQRLAETIVRESGGSPYFVSELVQYLREGGELGESLASSSSDVRLDEVLWRRIQRLPGEAQSLLEVLAVAGQPIRQAMACRIAGLGAEGFSGLALLRSHHLIRGTGPGSLDEVETYHDRIRETVVDHLPAERRRGWHRGLAQALEAAGGADPETLAVHFEEAGEAEKAGHYYGQAADEASKALAFDRAAKLYRRALELRPARDAEGRRRRTGLGEALANAGRGGEAAHAYQDASAGAEPTERLELQRRAAYQFLTSGRIDEGLSASSALLDRIGMPLPSTPRQALRRLLLNRARLRLRGLGFRERDAAQIAPEQLELVDIARSFAVGMSLVNTIRGADYQTRSLLLALRAGEPFRIALALGWEAVLSATQGRPTRCRTARLIRAAEALAQRLGHPHALGMMSLAAGIAEVYLGRYQTCLERVDRAEAIFREQCTGVVWELDTARIFGLWSLFFLGRLAELGDRSRVIFHEARERGDRYMEATPGPFVGAVVRLAADDVEGARTLAREALGPWSQRGFQIQHLNFYRGSLYADLYAGDAARAWQRVMETAPVLSSSLLLRNAQVRADALQHGGRCAIAMAATAADPKRLLRQAAAYARRLERERLPWTDALARLIRAGAASVQGDPDRAVHFLTVAAEGFEACGLELFAAATRRQLGRLLGGDEGRTLIARADDWMAGQAIRRPDRMTACLAPGFEKIQ
ncbi:MAG: AAA family ATPase [Planctomycetaceae bacterium]|nr:AAA family ATPase [Planctomycetaceae bacterium]